MSIMCLLNVDSHTHTNTDTHDNNIILPEEIIYVKYKFNKNINNNNWEQNLFKSIYRKQYVSNSFFVFYG